MPQGLVLLRSDNFTPPARTPWGGTKIVERYKQRELLADDKAAYECVGESWELSVEPAFPSLCQETGTPLRELLAAQPEAMLGEEARACGRSETALLVKLLDAKSNLSVQVHPADDYAGLAPGQSGKPECWYILEREEGAGIYFGLRPGVTRATVEAVLREDGDLSKLLRFVSVEPGDFFVIDPGTVHAIGAGVTLAEPQHVAPGCEGVTYRMWVWGEKRELHVEDALAVTAWDQPMDEQRLAQSRACFGPPRCGGPAKTDVLCGDVGGLESSTLRAARLHGTGRLALPAWDVLRGVTVVGGRVRVGELGWLEVGQTAAVAASRGAMEIELEEGLAVVTGVRCGYPPQP